MKTKSIRFEINSTKYSIGKLCKRRHSIYDAIQSDIVSKEFILEYLNINELERKTVRYSSANKCVLCGSKTQKDKRNDLKEKTYQILFEIHQVNGCKGYQNECSSNMNESNPLFNLCYLTIDHVENDGFIDRRNNKKTKDYHNEIVKLYEEGELNMIRKKYQPLCWNCNEMKGIQSRYDNTIYNKIK